MRDGPSQERFNKRSGKPAWSAASARFLTWVLRRQGLLPPRLMVSKSKLRSVTSSCRPLPSSLPTLEKRRSERDPHLLSGARLPQALPERPRSPGWTLGAARPRLTSQLNQRGHRKGACQRSRHWRAHRLKSPAPPTPTRLLQAR